MNGNSLTDRVKNEDLLHGVKEEKDIGYAVQRRRGNWIGYILCRNCGLKHTTERRRKG